MDQMQIETDPDIAASIGIAKHLAAGTFDKIQISAMQAFSKSLTSIVQTSNQAPIVAVGAFDPVAIDVSTLDRCVLLQMNILAILERLVDITAQYIDDFSLPLMQIAIQYLQESSGLPVELTRQVATLVSTTILRLGISPSFSYNALCGLLVMISNSQYACLQD